MRELEINKQTIYYALFTGYTDATDASGYKTGEKVKTYGNPAPCRINVSPASGNVMWEVFGLDTNYSKTMTTADLSCQIEEDSILWVGITPDSDLVGVQNPHNYVVVRKAVSLHDIVYAIREVTLNG